MLVKTSGAKTKIFSNVFFLKCILFSFGYALVCDILKENNSIYIIIVLLDRVKFYLYRLCHET